MDHRECAECAELIGWFGMTADEAAELQRWHADHPDGINPWEQRRLDFHASQDGPQAPSFGYGGGRL